MTWAKFGVEFRDECAEAGLTDAEFRTHAEALMYLYGIESKDLRIQRRRRLVRRLLALRASRMAGLAAAPKDVLSWAGASPSARRRAASSSSSEVSLRRKPRAPSRSESTRA